MFPLLAVSLIIYSILTLTIGTGWIDQEILEFTIVSGDKWLVTYGDAFIVASMGLLFVEFLRATNTGSDSLLNHALSFVVFLAALLLFILVPGYGNSVFFIYITMTLLDIMAGPIVTTITARRDFGVANGALGGGG